MKKIIIQLSPDPATGTATLSTTHVVHHTRITPRKDDDIVTVSQAVKVKWAATPAITLIWMTSAIFGTLADNFKTIVLSKKTTAGSRSPLTDILDGVDTQIDDGTREVKAYIANKFGVTHATANFAPFGIVHESQNWWLPHDHDRRSAALQMMIDAIAANGFGSNTYGTTFWTGIKTQFDNLVTQTRGVDGTVSSEVSDKNTQRTKILDVLHAILLVLEANYPDTFQGVRRDWGFQKEDY